MALAIGILSNLINYLLEHHQVITMFFFTGLIIGIIPYLLRTVKFNKTFKAKHYSIMVVGIIILVVITLMNSGNQSADTSLDLSFGLIIKYFLAGASSAMLLPGISGSFMLLVFGAYGTIMLAIADLVKLNFDGLPLLIVVGLGVLAGFYYQVVLLNTSYIIISIPHSH